MLTVMLILLVAGIVFIVLGAFVHGLHLLLWIGLAFVLIGGILLLMGRGRRVP
jgi:hypothetical protein